MFRGWIVVSLLLALFGHRPAVAEDSCPPPCAEMCPINGAAAVVRGDVAAVWTPQHDAMIRITSVLTPGAGLWHPGDLVDVSLRSIQAVGDSAVFTIYPSSLGGPEAYALDGDRVNCADGGP